MKKISISLILILITVLGSSAFMIKSSNGIAGYTGSPGEAKCSSCHGGGSSSSSGLTITSVPAFSVNINADTEYMPDTTYQITIAASASGFSKYGFGCEILTPSITNSGTMSAAGAGVKFVNSAGKRNAVHTTAKNGATALFTFKWTAPSSGDAIIYAIGNAVNGNNSDNGDFVIAPISLNLVAAPAPIPIDTTKTDVKVKEIENSPISHVSIFPNPANELVTMSYFLKQPKQIRIELININGAVVKVLHDAMEFPGSYSQILNLQHVPSGAYFVKTNANNERVAQKLIIIP